MNSFDALVQSLGLELLIEARTTDAGRGLFSIAEIPPHTVLFQIPASQLVNCRTLAPHYPAGLDAIQLISLHLGRYRRTPQLDPLFGPYISTLPREFSHPLTTHVHQTDSTLPPSVAIRKANSLTQLADEVLDADFLWGWLNVNTRCVYHRLKGTRSHPDNFTMCPILDLANHTVAGPTMIPRVSDAERNNAPPIAKLGDPLTLLSPATPTKPGEELYLTYGAHSNKTLFVEYGFVVPCAPDDPRAEVDVQDIVEPMFENQGNDGAAKMKILQDSGYWGDWTLDASPSVSYHLTTALRLLHVPLGDSGALERWQGTLTGLRDTVSDANESASKRTVADICAILIQRAKARMPETNSSMVRILWEEELHVAMRVSNMLGA
ncbi:hypothetical protein B0H14DRAFT_2660424 [Mycena olivaceomarginata]|nr:hypothetical protein B0H14DRAFT_2660424 [Mycena olivaceomarginata]